MRGFLLLSLALLGLWNPAHSGPWERIEPARALLGAAVPETGALLLELPAVTQDGSSVSLGVSLGRGQQATRIDRLYLFSTGNPAPELAEFLFGPAAGPLDLETRIRLDRSQQVIALALTEDGRWLSAVRDIRVTTSGCLVTGGDALEEDFMLARARGPARLRSDRPSEIRAMIRHPMETGLRRDADGVPMPRRIVEQLSVSLDGERVLEARLHPAIAAHPYLRFFVAAGRHGELALDWRESGGEQTTTLLALPAP